MSRLQNDFEFKLIKNSYFSQKVFPFCNTGTRRDEPTISQGALREIVCSTTFSEKARIGNDILEKNKAQFIICFSDWYPAYICTYILHVNYMYMMIKCIHWRRQQIESGGYSLGIYRV